MDDGGPIYPCTYKVPSKNPPYYEDIIKSSGMSLRDYFAGQCLDRMMCLSMEDDGSWSPSVVAAGCYQMADAMIKERNK